MMSHPTYLRFKLIVGRRLLLRDYGGWCSGSSWGHLWRCYVDYDWFERAPFEGASVPSAVGAQTWHQTMAQCRRGLWEEPHRSQHRSSCPEGIQGDYPHASSCTWLSVGVGFGRSLIGLSIGPLALKVFKVIIHMPLLVHGLHPQILFGLVRALNVVIVPVFAGCQSLFSSVVLNALQCINFEVHAGSALHVDDVGSQVGEEGLQVGGGVPPTEMMGDR